MDNSGTTKEWELEQYAISAENQQKLRARNAELEAEVVRLRKALRGAIDAGEYVVKLCEDDLKCGQSPSPLVKSCPAAVIAHCYAAMSFLHEAIEALEASDG